MPRLPRLRENRGFGWLNDFDGEDFNWKYEFTRDDILAEDWEVWKIDDRTQDSPPAHEK